MSVSSSVCTSVSRSVASSVAGAAVGDGAIRLSESEWEALTEYDWEQTYIVEGIGTYLGPTLIEPAEWNPQVGDLYVSKSGNDANDGTSEGQAKLTIASAFLSISTSNNGPITIWVDEGTYAENISSTGYFYIAAKNFAHPVTIRAKPGADVTLTGVSGNYVIIFYGVCGNISFRELTVASTASCVSVFTIQSNSLASNCSFLDGVFFDTNSKGTSVDCKGTGGTTNFAIKRSVWTSPSTFSSTFGNIDGAKFIGNTNIGTNSGGVTCTAGSMSGSGTYLVNSNKIEGALTLTSSTTSKLRVNAYANEVRNIVHTGGNATYPALLDIDRNVVSSTSQAGISITGYTLDGACTSNSVTTTANTIGIAWPAEGIAQNCTGALIDNNTIINNATSGHGLLIGVGGTDITATNNTIYCNEGGGYGVVLKGNGCTLTGNDIYGGSLFPLLLKGARNCVVTDNTIRSTVVGVVCAIHYSTENIDSTTPTAANQVTGNTFIVTQGPLWNQADDGSIGEDQILDTNTYAISGSGTWGSLRGDTLSSLLTLQLSWADYDVSTNDLNSTAA